MKKRNAFICVLLSAALLTLCLSGCAGGKTKSPLDPKNPTTVTIWNYYNADQLAAFDNLVKEFNNTVGQEQGIVVVSVSQGSIDNLASALLDAVDGKVGAADIPSSAAVYAESVYILNAAGALAPFDPYFTQEELDAYIPGFLEEGRLTAKGELFELPISKSTETFVVNTTDYQAFADASGIGADSIETYEDLTAAAKAYYEWTDAQTPEIPNDGKALYGRDSFANYLVVGARQLGHPMFTVAEDGTLNVDLDKAAFRTMWDNYYLPFISGYFAADAAHRSEDVKTGTILAMTGSTSGITYIPTTVTDANDETHDIEISLAKSLYFRGGEQVSVQQGAGFCMLKTSEAEQYATAAFLKWFTDVDRNLEFSITSGYSPVTKAANNAQKITEAFTVDSPKTQNVLNALLVSADVYGNDVTYTSPAFSGSKEVRTVLETALMDACVTDRAAVEQALSEGKTLEEATESFAGDAYFDAWFDALTAQIAAEINAG